MGRASNTPTKLLAYDSFEQTEGALSGKTLNLGGTWSGAGDAVDFTVIAADDVARRTEKSDANTLTGRYAIAGSAESPASRAQATVTVPIIPFTNSTEQFRGGVLLRYVNAENWLMGYLTYTLAGAFGAVYLKVAKRVAGTETTLASKTLATGLSALSGGYFNGVTVTLSAIGSSWAANYNLAGTQAPSTPLLSGVDDDLDLEGALEEGKAGLYDAWTNAASLTRSYSGFTVLGADPHPVVCYAGKSIEFNSQGVQRESEDGKTWGQPDFARGANFYLEPEGSDGRINRIVTLMRRNDVEAEADTHVEDKHSVEIKVRERFLLPR